MLHSGQRVRTPYNEWGSIVHLDNQYVTVATDFDQCQYHRSEIEEINGMDVGYATDYSSRSFDVGDYVCFKDMSIKMQVKSYSRSDDGEWFYELDLDDGNTIWGTDDNLLPYPSNNRTPHISSTKDYEPRFNILTENIMFIQFDTKNGPSIVWGSVLVIKQMLKYSRIFKNVRTFIPKSGNAFPGTERISEDVLCSDFDYKEIPHPRIGAKVYLLSSNEWGIIEDYRYCDNFGIKVGDRTIESYSRNVFFVPPQSLDKQS